MIKLILFLSLIFSSSNVQATVEYGAINNFTRQYTMLEDGGLYTPFGWESVGEKYTNDLKAYGESLGYSYTEFPYLIESLFSMVIVLIASLSLWYAIIKKQNILLFFKHKKC